MAVGEGVRAGIAAGEGLDAPVVASTGGEGDAGDELFCAAVKLLAGLCRRAWMTAALASAAGVGSGEVLPTVLATGLLAKSSRVAVISKPTQL